MPRTTNGRVAHAPAEVLRQRGHVVAALAPHQHAEAELQPDGVGVAVVEQFGEARGHGLFELVGARLAQALAQVGGLVDLDGHQHAGSPRRDGAAPWPAAPGSRRGAAGRRARRRGQPLRRPAAGAGPCARA